MPVITSLLFLSRTRMHPLLNIAVRAARRAGEIIVRSLVRLESLEVTSKGRNDYVSEIDRSRRARDHRHHPQALSRSMRSWPRKAARSGDSEIVWIIDPLDGTTNFLHGFPVFAVSIAVEQRGRLEVGTIYDPMRQEIFTAVRGAGAHLDNRRMRVSKQRTLEGALLATGFPFRHNDAQADTYFATLRTLMRADRRHSPPRLRGARSGLRGGRSRRWLLGDGTQALGYGRRHADDPGSRRTRRHTRRQRYRLGANIVAGAPKVYEAMIEAMAPHVPDDCASCSPCTFTDVYI